MGSGGGGAAPRPGPGAPLSLLTSKAARVGEWRVYSAFCATASTFGPTDRTSFPGISRTR
jgi:hypothetical protein